MKYIKKKCGDEASNYVTHILENAWYGWLQNTNLTMTINGGNTELIVRHDLSTTPKSKLHSH